MKILKRNQLIVLVVSLMLITAGYLNFTANKDNVQTSTLADRDDKTIGDAQLVSTVPKENEAETVKELVSGENPEEKQAEAENETNKNEIQTNAEANNNDTKEKTEDYYFTTSKLERTTMYSELLETYQEIYNNTNASNEAKTEAFTQINKINNTKNAIMIAENLVIAKGFEDVVIFVNENSVSVIIKAEELKEEKVAQVQNIVSRELNVGAEIIHISNK